MSVVNHLALADQVYKCGKAAHIVRHSVSFPELGTFYRALRELQRKLGSESDEEYWAAFFRPLRRYLFLLSSTPLNADDTAIYNPDLIGRLEAHLSRAKLIYPSFADEAQRLVSDFSQIPRQRSSPLLAAVREIGDPWKESALLLKDTRFTEAIENVLPADPFGEIEVVGTNQLRSEICYDRLFVLGAPCWYPEYIFTAPRAPEIHVVAYTWLRIAWKGEPAFIHADSGARTIRESASTSEAKTGEEVYAGDLFSGDELLPQLNLDAFSERLAQRYESAHEYDVTDASLFSLEGGLLVFLDTAEKSKVLIIDPDGDTSARATGKSARLRRIPATYVEPGTYILLRTGGGGDYIVPLADRSLGKNAPYIRSCQQHWKELLRKETSSKGLFAVSVALLDLGSIRAEETNLRNWMSSRNIRPDDERDFAAIMKLIGLGQKIEEYWRNARALTNAHLRAGAYIRRMLLKEVATADLDELERTGRMVFELPGNDAGSMTAFRVLSVSHKKYKIPVSQLDDPFEGEDDLWPE